ncbi:MAG: transcription antiterminator [Clostridium sp.]|nr:transcription antiterminator [Clostridium sp.]
MEFFPRAKRIISLLLREDKPVSTKKIAEEINVSKRTVQRDMDYISYVLKKCNLNLASKAGSGIWIEGNDEQKDIFLSKLNEDNEFDAGNRDERQKKLILELIKNDEPKKIYYYSNKFKVSDATIRNDLEDINASWMKDRHLSIIRKQGYGVYIEGEEKFYRRAVKICIDENLDKGNWKYILNGNVRRIFKKLNEKGICELLDINILEEVILCLNDIEDDRIRRLAEQSYISLILHISIAIERCMKKEIVENDEEFIEKIRNDENYNLASYISRILEDKFKIKIPEIETAFFCLHITGAKSQYVNNSGISIKEEEYQRNLVSLVGEMIDNFDEKISFDLKNDEDFINGLIAHLQPSIVRLNNKMSICNPLLDQIKDKYHDIYKKSVRSARVLERELNVIVPDDEIGFIAMHFGAELVKLKNKKEVERKVRIGIVCASGIGISRLMSARVKEVFKGKVEVIVLAMDELKDEAIQNVDFLISSIDLGETKKDFVKINPLLLENDLEMINSRIDQYSHSVKDIAEQKKDFSTELSNVVFVAEQISVIINNFKFLRFDEKIGFEQLLKLIGDTIGRSESDDSDIQDSISRNVQDRIIKREKLMSQIMPELDFALLHSRCQGIKYPYFMSARTDTNSSFKDSYFKNIGTVIIMLTPEDSHAKENGDILGHLSSRLIEDDSLLNVIKTCDGEKIKSFISSELRVYFNRYLKNVYDN